MSKNRLHIVIVSPVFAIDEEDSVSVPFLQLFCKELIKNNITLTVISEQYPICDDYDWYGVRVRTLKKKTPKILYKFLRSYRLKKVLKKIHADNPIDVIHNFWYNILGMISEKFALKHSIKHIITLSGQDILPENTFLSDIKEYSGTLVCPSEFSRKKLLENHQVNIQVIGCGIERIKLIPAERTIDLIQCGWINSVKNNLQFLEIVKALQKTNSITKVVICGGGPMFKELLLNIERLDLKNLVEVKDSIPRSEVIRLMQQSKLLIHTSHFESFGLVLAEAMSCGCKVISTPVGIAFDDQEIIRCVTTDEFVKAIKTTLHDFSNVLKESTNAYPVSTMAESYLRLYSKT